MPFIPHTQADIDEMLAEIGARSIDELFDEIPAHLRHESALDELPAGLSEMEMARLLQARAQQDEHRLNFIGAGAYEHHIPAAVWEIATRGEFMTAYTPYQAEASQGTLQLLYEFQTMMSSLTGMEVSNASLYDGASALAEAILMAVRANRQSKSKRILLPRTLNPIYRRVAATLVGNQGIQLETVDFDAETGLTPLEMLNSQAQGDEVTALVIPYPNFFGHFEAVDQLTDWAHQHQALVIAVVNPTALALVKAPGSWGEKGADIVCGEGQPLGIPLASGGPYFGFLCSKNVYVRQMPGRIIGQTVDQQGRPGFALTLQAREQHIRRSKATSNICTNQGLAVTAATIYMSLLGPNGLKNVAIASHQNQQRLMELCTAPAAQIQPRFSTPHRFHEGVIQLPVSAADVLALMAQQGIEAGVDLSQEYPELTNCLLVCCTETKTDADLTTFHQALTQACEQLSTAAPTSKAETV